MVAVVCVLVYVRGIIKFGARLICSLLGKHFLGRAHFEAIGFTIDHTVQIYTIYGFDWQSKLSFDTDVMNWHRARTRYSPLWFLELNSPWQLHSGLGLGTIETRGAEEVGHDHVQ